jgi:hypothetical protein
MEVYRQAAHFRYSRTRMVQIKNASVIREFNNMKVALDRLRYKKREKRRKLMLKMRNPANTLMRMDLKLNLGEAQNESDSVLRQRVLLELYHGEKRYKGLLRSSTSAPSQQTLIHQNDSLSHTYI